MKANDHKALNCIDLFSGAGGFSLSARMAGLRVHLAIENNKHAVSTYRRNLCEGYDQPTFVVNEDISTLSPVKVRSDCFGDHLQCDLLLGGPPCQGFSTHRIKDAGVSDARNDLIHTYFEFVSVFQPTAFLMENVPGMLWRRHQSYLSRFFLEGDQAGYTLFDPVILDARDFGVPQRRKRVFILGVKKNINKTEFTWPSPTHGNEAARQQNVELAPWVNCSSIFAKASSGDPNDVHMNHTPELVEAFKHTPANGGSRKDSGRMLKCHEGHDGHKDVYGRIDPSKPGPTMTTACINPSKGRFVHPTEHHGITVRQAARMQTFPESFIFEGGLIAAGQQVGNAVPVKLGHALIKHIKPLLKSQTQSPTAKASRRVRELV